MNNDGWMDSPLERVECTSAIDFNAGLRTITISPGGKVRSRIGDFVMDATAGKAICDDFTAHGTEVCVDYEHQSVGGEYARRDGRAPAAGWLAKLFYEDGQGLRGLVRWNAEAREAIRKHEYSYLSPVFLVRKTDRRPVVLLSVGLTNVPAIAGLEKVAAKATVHEELWIMSADGGNTNTGTATELLAKLAKHLGIEIGDSIGSQAAEILTAALAKLTGGQVAGGEESTAEASSVREALGLSSGSQTETVVLAIRALQSSTDNVVAFREQQRNAFLQPFIDKGVLDPKAREVEYATVCRTFDRDPEDAKIILRSFSSIMAPEGRTTPPGEREGKRGQIIRSARTAFKADTFAQKATSEQAFVNSSLRDEALESLSDSEVEAHAIAKPTD